MSNNIDIQKDLEVDRKTKVEVEKVERDIDTLSKVTFVSDLLTKQTEIRNVLDVRSNIVIGFNSAIIVLLVTYFKEKFFTMPLLWLLMAVVVISLILAIIALKPPHYHSKKGQAESIFYHHYIDSKEMEAYRQEIHKVLENDKNIFDAYITETYNLTKYSNIPRKLYLYSSLRVLIYGSIFIVLLVGILWLLNYLGV